MHNEKRRCVPMHVAFLHTHVAQCQSGSLVASDRSHLADINGKEYWTSYRIARRAEEPGSEVV